MAGNHAKGVTGSLPNTPGDILSRIYASDVYTLETPCWSYKGTPNRCGYSRAKIGGKEVLVHRLAYEHYVGLIPEGLEIDHLCRNRWCCNPAHLEPVSGKENKLRGETLNAGNARKTHCPRGHPYSGSNLRIKVGKKKTCRVCVACSREQASRRYYERKQAGTLRPGRKAGRPLV